MKLHYSPLEARDTAALWEGLLACPPRLLAVDTETVSLQNRTLIGVGIAVSPDDAFYIGIGDADWGRALQVLRDPSVKKVWHNAPFDLRVLRQHQIDITNIEDTAILSRLVKQTGALELVSFGTGIQTENAGAVAARYGSKEMSTLPFDVVGVKCCRDALATYRLWLQLAAEVTSTQMANYHVDRDILVRLERMSARGLALDQSRVKELDRFYTQQAEIIRVMCASVGFDPAKPRQVGYMLNSRGHYLPFTDGAYRVGRATLRTSDNVLRKLDDSIAATTLAYRHATKQLSFIRPMKGQQRAYTTLHMDAVTGRISSTSAGKTFPDRNLQNLPKKVETGDVAPVRSMFVPDNEWFTLVDASQIELRIVAHLSGDKAMQSVFADPKGDIHHTTQEGLSRLLHRAVSREYAKGFNFAVLYNAEDDTIADALHTSDVQSVRQMKQAWFQLYPGVAQWREEQQRECLQSLRVQTLYGRVMPLDATQSEKHLRNCSINWPVQGTAAEIFKRMLLYASKLAGYERLPVHDEIIYDGDIKGAVDAEGLAHVSPVRIPVEVTRARSLGEKER